MGAVHCDDCTTQPVMRCGRCTRTRCAVHALLPGERCAGCEQDWSDEAPTRRAAKLLFVPPIAVLVGGLLLGLLMPISLGGAIGAIVIAALACGTGVGAGAGACRLVDRSARALFLRERAGGLPSARLLTDGRHR
jgi:hypothetical protein